MEQVNRTFDEPINQMPCIHRKECRRDSLQLFSPIDSCSTCQEYVEDFDGEEKELSPIHCRQCNTPWPKSAMDEGICPECMDSIIF